MEKRFDTVLDTQGRPVSGATVLVTEYPGGATATIYSDDGVTEASNPLTTDANGYFEYLAANGHYTWLITTTTTTKTIQDVLHEDAPIKEFTFTETSGAGTYTATCAQPAGSTLLDIIVNGVALWDNAGAVTMKIGDATNDDGFFTGINLKATDLAAGETLSLSGGASTAGGKEGADVSGSQVNRRYSAAARNIAAVVTSAGAGGTAGRTRVTFLFSVPKADDITAATKV